MGRDRVVTRGMSEAFAEEAQIVGAAENRCAVVATLDDVQPQVGYE